MQLVQLCTYGAAIAVLLFASLAYHISSGGRTSNKAVAEADYLMNDPSQQQFFENKNLSAPHCNCSSPFSSLSYNQTLVEHGEYAPLFVPESLQSIPLDILDKIAANTISDSVIVTVANYPMRKELYNWMEWMREAQEENFLVFCIDPKLYLHLVVAGHEEKAVLVPDDWFVSDLELMRNSTTPLLDSVRLSHVKTWILQQLAYLKDTHTMMLDVNQVILRPRTREYIQTLLNMRPDTHLIATQDSSDQHVVNTGLTMIRGGDSSKQLKRLLANTIQIQESQYHLHQQEALNLAMVQMELNVKTGMIVLLDMIHFPNGHQYFESKRLKVIEPFIVHANHKTGESRIKLLQEHQFWKPVDDRVDGISRQVDEIYAKRKQHLDKLKGEQDQSIS
ncbi:hypothetical protein EDC96DRAFT_606153 [Choanephora cucurbitarum]|nr:hypothetical protein EDC96DRAFT_606153 [Choanephora cucurbitarum]